jgi:hypothetical protein
VRWVFFITSFEEGKPRRSNEWIATSSNRRGRGGQTLVSLWEVFDLPRCALFKVAIHSSCRAQRPLLEGEGFKAT